MATLDHNSMVMIFSRNLGNKVPEDLVVQLDSLNDFSAVDDFFVLVHDSHKIPMGLCKNGCFLDDFPFPRRHCRGTWVQEHPLMMVGVDFNEEFGLHRAGLRGLVLMWLWKIWKFEAKGFNLKELSVTSGFTQKLIQLFQVLPVCDHLVNLCHHICVWLSKTLLDLPDFGKQKHI